MTGPARPPGAAPDGHYPDGSDAGGGHGSHGAWVMLLCCIPMVIAIVAIIIGGR